MIADDSLVVLGKFGDVPGKFGDVPGERYAQYLV
jgi:hypothetical protein